MIEINVTTIIRYDFQMNLVGNFIDVLKGAFTKQESPQ